MTEQEFDTMFDNGELDTEYGEYIYNHGFVGNGDMLIEAMDSFEFYDDFKEYMLSQEKVDDDSL